MSTKNPTRPHSRQPGRLLSFCAPALVAIIPIGCHSRFIEATIDNRSSSAVRLIEVDYPSASFGVGNLAAHSQFHYRFKVQGSGGIKLEFTDDAGKIHNVEGPELNQGQEGRLTILIGSAGEVSWQPSLTGGR